jgi:hypothetical protein
MSAVALELVQPSLEDCEGEWTSDIEEVDLAVSAWLVATELAGNVGALDHYLLVREANQRLQDALDGLSWSTSMLSRHSYYAGL